MLPVPIIPVVADGPTLEDSCDDEDKTKKNVKNYGTPDEPANLGSWKDSEVEKEEGKL